MEQKTLEYEGSLCKEELILKVDSYRCKNRLFIAMIKKKDQEEELYDILTVSLPGENIKINEAFISDFECKYKLSFIRKYKLGEVLQRVGHSGFCDYRLVRFDLENLFVTYGKSPRCREFFRTLNFLMDGKEVS